MMRIRRSADGFWLRMSGEGDVRSVSWVADREEAFLFGRDDERVWMVMRGLADMGVDLSTLEVCGGWIGV